MSALLLATLALVVLLAGLWVRRRIRYWLCVRSIVRLELDLGFRKSAADEWTEAAARAAESYTQAISSGRWALHTERQA